MKVVIKGPVRDILSFISHINRRRRIFKKEPAAPLEEGKMNKLAGELHPVSQKLIIDSIREEGGNARTYCLRGFYRNPAFFIPGQYVSIGFRIGASTVWRPFSISSLPQDTRGGGGSGKAHGYYEITVKKEERGGFVAAWIWEGWKIGTGLTATAPCGTFTHQRLRDSKYLICISGGSGIIPFKPLISTLLSRDPEARVLLFQGARSKGDLLYSSHWKETERIYEGRFLHIPVLSEAKDDWTGDKGLISASLIEGVLERSFKGMNPGAFSYFICGPEGLHFFMKEELKKLDIPKRRIRREEYALISTPSTVKYKLTVRQDGVESLLEADAGETVLTALERGGLNPPSLCRSGECGWCRSRLISGKVLQAEGRREKAGLSVDEGGLRAADKKFGYFHPCSVYPGGDLVIELPRNPIKRSEL